MRRLLLSVAALLAFAVPAVAQAAAAAPIVIGHRGASAYRPEHTAMSYKLAIQMGADFIEPDLVMTKDGVLVARHENEIGRTTDVAGHPEFADRKVTRAIEGETFTGWFVEDFTLAELKTLRSRERRPEARPESARYDGRESVFTLQEIIDIAKAGAARGRPVGLYVELKNPDYFRRIGLPMEKALIDVLAANGLNTAEAPVIIQSFFPSALIALRGMTPIKLMFLVNSQPPPAPILAANHIARWSDVWSPDGLKKIAAFADIVGPEIQIILPRGVDGKSLSPGTFVADAHAAGLKVHVWSVNPENLDLPVDLRCGVPSAPGFEHQLGDAETEARRLFAVGVDGAFSDAPDMLVRVRSEGRRAWASGANATASCR
uniref:glycerophosphodiester phosphodiesterase n=1 Tax=Caulobacter sp. (strain K31) TaxID=366602 RepID=B0SVP3_CAUSK